MLKALFLFVTVFAFVLTPLGKSAEGDTVAGKWHFVFDTPGGDREFDSIFQQAEGKVTGKWGVSDMAKEGDAVAGTFTEKKLALEFAANSAEVGPGTMKITGKLAEDGTITGDWSFQDYSGTFKAAKIKE